MPETIPAPIAEPSQRPLLFASVANDALLGYRATRLARRGAARHEDLLFEIVDHLPQEATEALLKQIRSIKAAAGHIPAA